MYAQHFASEFYIFHQKMNSFQQEAHWGLEMGGRPSGERSCCTDVSRGQQRDLKWGVYPFEAKGLEMGGRPKKFPGLTGYPHFSKGTGTAILGGTPPHFTAPKSRPDHKWTKDLGHVDLDPPI